MTETITSKVKQWSYPLKVGSSEATDPQQLYTALAKAKDGYYPLGANGLWHGGVHFDEDTGLVTDLTEVRCIADGEVVAYRIDEAYPKSDFGSTQAVYSTGFVLVKHRLEAPAPPATLGAASAAPTPGPSLVFFSLYMHLLDWEGYKANPALGRPSFWSGGTCQVKAAANDEILGLRVRLAPKGKPGYGTVLTVLPRGTVVETGEENHGWLKVMNVIPADIRIPAGTGWVFKAEMTAGATPNSYVIGSAAKDPMTPPQKGLAVHAAASQSSAVTAILPIGTQVEIGNDGTPGKYQKLLEIVTGDAVPELTASNGLLGYVWEGLLETTREPAGKNAVHVLEQPFPIKAGALMGHVGKYQNYSDPAPRNLLHLEVFSCEDVKAFTALSKSNAVLLPAAEKTLVKIYKGSALIIHVEGMNAANPPKVSDAHNQIGHDFFIPVAVLEALPAEKKIKVPVVMGAITTYTFWWHLEGLLADVDGKAINGWFAEPDTVLSRHSPFEWEGFSFIEETTSNADHLAALLHAQESLDEQERETWLPSIGSAIAGSVNEALYKILDRNGDKKITPSEISEALSKPWISQPISQMVTCYESEWQYTKEKWDSLDELMGNTGGDLNESWRQEKLRINSLGWWEKLMGRHGVGDDAKVWYIHPLALLTSFAEKTALTLITLEMLKKAKSSITDAYCESILPFLNRYAKVYGIDTSLRLAHFLGQVGHESGFKIQEENLNYTAVRMRKIFGCRNNQAGYNDRTDECIISPRLRPKLWSDPVIYASNAINLGSYVYANRNGNGDEASQEGYKYRGRGIIQLTGKSNYREYTRIHNQRNPSDLRDFVEDPDLIINEIMYGIESAFVWWDINKMNDLIESSYAARTEVNIAQHVADVSLKVNGGTIGLVERVALFNELRGMISAKID